MILLENYIEQYLSQIRFDVTEELKAFDYPDGQAREYSNQSSFYFYKKKDTRLEPFQLQHHLSSHMKEQLEFNSVQTRTQQQHSQKEQTTSYAHVCNFLKIQIFLIKNRKICHTPIQISTNFT